MGFELKIDSARMFKSCVDATGCSSVGCFDFSQ